ncbi:MAG: acyl carrier protein [Proteobacteria bacterium]|nr:acyl carrier protein [Pseudomonadota bacterium]
MLSKEDIYKKLSEIMKREFGFEESQLTLKAHLVDDLDLDSIDAIDLAVWLEEEMGQSLAEEDLRSIRTVEDVIDAVHLALQTG